MNTPSPPRIRLCLGDRPRLEIPVQPAPPGALPAWLVVALPSPLAEPRPSGRFRADPRLPESEVALEWSTAPAVGTTLAVLTVTAGDESWTLEQDLRNPGRWLELTHTDLRRHWS